MRCFVQGGDLCEMFCPGWQICVRCFVQGGKSVFDVLSSLADLCEMFCPGRQICVRCFVQGGISI